MKQEKKGAQFLLFVFSVFLIFHAYAHYKYLTLVANYRGITAGKILTVEERPPLTEYHLIVKYGYVVNDSVLFQEEEISRGLNYRPFLKSGRNLMVRFNLDNPSEATAVQNEDFVPIYLVFALIISICLLQIFRKQN